MSTVVDQQIERVMALANDAAKPSSMSQEEAIEFYEELANQCQEWARTIRAEMREAER